ncbi:MAG: hypothetical protein EOP11_06735 [Proteobacteria bacterium]|nr:MAG: hypothetical protein EOP11_06735 [Pseudomonadota bacterium]
MRAISHARNLAALQPTAPQAPMEGPYGGFTQINGHHPWKFAVPNGYVDYEARILRGSKVVYFNFALAKEMGLIAKDHAEKLGVELEKMLVETFALRIINEYDQLTGLKVPARDLKPGRYMATRYVQLQHDNKAGTTSGDGRSIWNGQFLHPVTAKAWDISSCGTGATRLSPGAVALGRPIQTGDKEVSYGSGLADIDEGLTAAILSESFHSRGIYTERTLVILETPDGRGLNVRAAPNLLRPSHLFLPLKQGNQLMLKSALDFYIARQMHNKAWATPARETDKYDHFLQNLAENYGAFAARLEDEYVFCWLDWDGDNMLMDGGIIDYGSIRQFGLCHHRYRYDDVQRFSTNLKEQKRKARYLVQTFVQLVDFVRTGQKKDVKSFSASPVLKAFDVKFEEVMTDCMLRRVGLGRAQRKELMRRRPAVLRDFEKSYRYFERKESSKGMHATPDGVNNPVIFSVRNLLKELPRRLLTQDRTLDTKEFLELMKTPYLTKKESESASYKAATTRFQKLYLRLLKAGQKSRPVKRALLEAAMRSGPENKIGHATGDGIIYVVDELLASRKNLGRNEFVSLVDALMAVEKGAARPKLGARARRSLAQLGEIVANHWHTI